MNASQEIAKLRDMLDKCLRGEPVEEQILRIHTTDSLNNYYQLIINKTKGRVMLTDRRRTPHSLSNVMFHVNGSHEERGAKLRNALLAAKDERDAARIASQVSGYKDWQPGV